MVKERRRKRSFLAHDENGRDHVINVWVEILDTSSAENPDEETEGTNMLETRDGQRLNWRGKGKYQIALSGETLTSNHPDAP